MKKLLSLLLCAALAVLPAACNPYFEKKSRSFEAMDTFVKLDAYGVTALTLTGIQANIEGLDVRLSVTNDDDDGQNEIYCVNQNGKGTVSPVVSELARQSVALCAETDGALDITILPVVEEWGFLSKNYQIPSKERLETLTRNVDYSKVRVEGDDISLPSGMRLDFGAVAKGYAAGLCYTILKEAGTKGAILNLGGTVVAYGEKPEQQLWKIGIADPENSASYMGYLQCTDKIIATSGSYERYFKGEDGKTYSHIIDPKTGVPVDNGIQSVTIVSDDGLRSDGLSTALFVMGKEKAEAFYQSHRDFDYIMLTADKKAYVTPGIAADFTVADGYDYEVIELRAAAV